MFTQAMLANARPVHQAMRVIRDERLASRRDVPQRLIFEVPTETFPVFGLFGIDGGEHPFLTLIVGPDAEAQCECMFNDDPGAIIAALDLIMADWQPFGTLPNDQRHLIQGLIDGVEDDTLVPNITRKAPGRMPRAARAAELETVHYALRAIIEAFSDASHVVPNPDTSKFRYALVVSGPPETMSVRIELRRCASTLGGTRTVAEADAEELERTRDRIASLAIENATLEDWRITDRRAQARCRLALTKGSIHATRALERYFGDVTDGLRFIDAGEGSSAAIAYMNWKMRYDRGASGEEPTAVELALAGDLFPLERAYFEAWARALPSLHRIEVDVSGGTTALIDTLGLARWQAPRGTFASDVHDGHVLPATIFRIGPMGVLKTLGPAIPPDRLDAVVPFLTSFGLRLTPTSIACSPHVFGRLWPFIEPPRGPRLNP